MLNILRKLRDDKSGATAFENGLIVVAVVTAAVAILGQVEGSVRDVFEGSAVQTDTDWEQKRR